MPRGFGHRHLCTAGGWGHCGIVISQTVIWGKLIGHQINSERGSLHRCKFQWGRQGIICTEYRGARRSIRDKNWVQEIEITSSRAYFEWKIAVVIQTDITRGYTTVSAKLALDIWKSIHKCKTLGKIHRHLDDMSGTATTVYAPGTCCGDIDNRFLVYLGSKLQEAKRHLLQPFFCCSFGSQGDPHSAASWLWLIRHMFLAVGAESSWVVSILGPGRRSQ